LKEQLEDQIGLVEGAKALAEQVAGQLGTAEQKLDGLAKQEKDLMEQIGQVKNQLSELREELSKLKKAGDAILEIKKYVSATALKMDYYSDVAVRVPVREIGLAADTQVWDYFKKNVAEECETGAPPFKKELSSFHQYCTLVALPEFEKVKEIVDLTPLCRLDEEENIALEMDKAVQARVNILTEDLEHVQSWLQHYKGSHMTAQDQEEKVERGEPEGLRQIITVYGATKLYTRYLKEWKLDRGSFQKLLDQLAAEISASEADIVETDELLNSLKERLAAVASARGQAQTEVDDALAQQSAALKNQDELEQKMLQLKTNIEESQNLLTDLDELLRQAILKYKEARTHLISEHTAGKGTIFSLSQVNGHTLLDA